ncbi:MAG: DUF2938 domain-containing protein [Perlucidibaca sp.]
MQDLTTIIITGAGATLVTDAWGLARYGLVGRWFGHMRHGRFHHAAIARAEPVTGERLIGWSAHYLIGIAFAALLVLLTGPGWLQAPTLAPALLFGLTTVAAPFLLMQPGMGAGIAAARTPAPGKARLHSLITHAVFGLGLYLTATLISGV